MPTLHSLDLDGLDGIEDALSRMNNSAQAEPRFMEVMKPVLALVDFGEYAAVKCIAPELDSRSTAAPLKLSNSVIRIVMQDIRAPSFVPASGGEHALNIDELDFWSLTFTGSCLLRLVYPSPALEVDDIWLTFVH